MGTGPPMGGLIPGPTNIIPGGAWPIIGIMGGPPIGGPGRMAGRGGGTPTLPGGGGMAAPPGGGPVGVENGAVGGILPWRKAAVVLSIRLWACSSIHFW